MGTVIRFPDERRMAWKSAALPMASGEAAVVILPVVRVERSEDESGGLTPQAGTPGGGRRRPGRRS
jgi:hypothetical protein